MPWHQGGFKGVPYKHLTQSSFIFAILPFFGVGELDIHITVHRVQLAMIFHAPFELDNDVLSCQLLEEGLWVDL